MVSEIDNDSDGQVDYEEFVSFVFHQEEPPTKTDIRQLRYLVLELQEELMDMRARAGYSAAHDAQYGGYESPRSGDAGTPRSDHSGIAPLSPRLRQSMSSMGRKGSMIFSPGSNYVTSRSITKGMVPNKRPHFTASKFKAATTATVSLKRIKDAAFAMGGAARVAPASVPAAVDEASGGGGGAGAPNGRGQLEPLEVGPSSSSGGGHAGGGHASGDG